MAGELAQSASAPEVRSARRLPLNLTVIGWLTRIAELGALSAAGTIATWLLSFDVPADLAANYGRLILMSAVTYLVVAESIGVNDVEAQLSVRTSWQRVASAWVVTGSLMIFLGFLLKVSEDFSRAWVLAWFATGLFLLFATRTVVTLLTRHVKRQGVLNQRVAIYGAGPQGARLAEYIEGHDKLTLDIVGFYDDRTGRDGSAGLQVRGASDQLIADIRAGRIDQVIVALPWSAEKRLREIVELVATTPVRIRLAPDIASFIFAKRPVVLLGEVPMMTLFERPISGLDQAVKWLEDHIFAALLLVLLSPLMLAIAIAIRIDSPGPIFFRQRREGFNNRPFMVWKYRSMYVDRCETDSIVQARRGDSRVTRVGAFLRKTSLDELPQLFNVLLGHMSLVGPRPHAPSTRAGGRLFSEVVATYASRHKVKPGITGWAQVCGWRGETSTEDQLVKRLEHDLHYVENWSFWFDLYILFRTAGTFLLHKTAY